MRVGLVFLAGIRLVGWVAAGENLAGGFFDVASAEFAFMDEPLCAENHRGNILSCNYTDVGIGVAVDASGALWITQDFIGR